LTKELLPFADYRRIFRTIFTALETVDATTNKACIFFAMTGAAILRTYYRMDAELMAGAAVYAVGHRQNSDERLWVSFGKIEGNQIKAIPEAFHCWIECKGFAIDFMTPIFQENLRESGVIDAVIPRRVFQKPLASMSPILPQDFVEGAFHLVPNRELLEEVVRGFGSTYAQEDLLKICGRVVPTPPKAHG
jgi:hypothetical protein